MNRVSFQFNTNKYYIDNILVFIQDKITNLVHSSEDLIVYNTSNGEIMVDRSGAVYIDNYIDNGYDLLKLLKEVEDEYLKLCSIDSHFEKPSHFKIIVPKNISKSIRENLNSESYNFKFIETSKNDALIIYN